MPLSNYHQSYQNLSDEEIDRIITAKAAELQAIFREVPYLSNDQPVKIAVIGCGDRRFVARHQTMFEEVLKRPVEVVTFDITTEHLHGEQNITEHDCTLPLPGGPFDLTYAHVILKFIHPDKQWELLFNSFTALKPGGLALHVFDREEIESSDERLADGHWAVRLETHKQRLTDRGIKFVEVPVKYGLALVLKTNR